MLEKAEWSFFDKVIQEREGKKRAAKTVAPKWKRNRIRAGMRDRPSAASTGQESKNGRLRITKSMAFTGSLSSVVQCRGRR